MSELVSLENYIEPNGRILIVDDNRAIHDDYYRILDPDDRGDDELDELDRELFGASERIAGAQFELSSAFQGEEAVERVRAAREADAPYAVAFVDVRMPPGMDGIEAATRMLDDDPDLCVVICSAYSDYDWDAMHGMFGTTDRVVMLKKPFDTIEVRQLAHALRRRWELTKLAAIRLEDMRAMLSERTRELELANERLREEAAAREDALRRLHESNEEIKALAYQDGLTGLPNRRLFDEHFAKIIARARRKQSEFAVLFLDFDNFKQLNDTIGHEGADAVLRSLAGELARLVRSDDVLALYSHTEPADPEATLSAAGDTDSVLSRLGGDEFALLLPETKDRFAAGAVARRILEHLNQPVRAGDQETFVTASIGIALFPADGDSPEALMRNADTAMYHAKQMGKGTYQYYSESMQRAAAERLNIETALRRAVESDQLELAYLPVYELATRTVVGVEALLRWHHPELGEVEPATFIPVAEECGLVLPIGQWVIDHACRQARAWHDAGLAPGALHVNISATELARQDLGAVLRAAAEGHGLAPGALGIDVREDAIMALGDDGPTVLAELRAGGIEVALDDFGTGYSSLSWLKRLPMNTLKIDAGLASETLASSRSAAVVETIVTLAHELEMRTVVEGVETPEQLELLHRLGCGYAQGRALCAPIPAAELEPRLPRAPAASRALS